MPYRRKRMYRKRRRGRPAWYNKKYSVAQIANSAWKTAKYLKSVINVEKKVLDTDVTTNPDSSGFVTHLSAIAQGDTISNREGQSVKAVGLHLKWSCKTNSSATTGTPVRLIVFQDNQQVSDSSPAVTDVLNSADVLSFLNKDTLGRFTILKDVLFAQTPDTDNNIITREWSIPLSHHIRYNGTASSDIQKGGLYFLGLSDQATNSPTFDCNVRLRYVDN